MKKKSVKNKVKRNTVAPHIATLTVICVLAAVSLVLSFVISDSSWASVFSNIFAGLFTGVILYLLSGVKQGYLAKEKSKRAWLNILHEYALEFIDGWNELLSYKGNREETYDKLYDLSVKAKNIEAFIHQSRFDQRLMMNPEEIAVGMLHFNLERYEECNNQLYERILNEEYGDKKSQLALFEDVHHMIFVLNSSAISLMNDIDITVERLNQTIF